VARRDGREGRTARRGPRRGLRLGLRGKLALTVAAVTALVAALIGVLVHEQTSRTQLASARQALDARLLDAVRDYQMLVDGGVQVEPPDLPAPLRETVTEAPVRATYLERGGTGPVLWAATAEHFGPDEADGQDGRDEEDGQNGQREHGEHAEQGEENGRGEQRVLAVRQSYQPQAEALADLDRTLLGAGLVAALLGSLLGLVPAAVAGRRISGAARTAQRIAAGDLTARVRPRGKDEIARMATAVNTMAEALGARLEAERRITADIAHELRTPVAGLVTAAELLPPGRPTELVRDRAGTLRRLVEDVLEVARLDTEGAEWAEFECCRTSVLARHAVAACADQREGGRPIRVELRADAEVWTDPRRVARVLANLLSNAVRHGAPPVSLEVDGRVLRLRDHGPGLPAELLAHGPQRFRTGARERGTGTGLGLTIVTGQARLLGAVVSWSNAPDGGAITTVELPAGAPP
jgi:signal transduction histidine kinase